MNMNKKEIEQALSTLTMIIDTREHDTESSRHRIRNINLPYVRQKLDFGDYSCKITLSDSREIDFSNIFAVERKMNIDELALCFTSERERFEREFIRAKDKNAKIYLLIENSSWEQVISGKYKSKMSSNALVASIITWLIRYDCQIIMCDELVSWRIIKEILYREAKNYLKNSSP